GSRVSAGPEGQSQPGRGSAKEESHHDADKRHRSGGRDLEAMTGEHVIETWVWYRDPRQRRKSEEEDCRRQKRNKKRADRLDCLLDASREHCARVRVDGPRDRGSRRRKLLRARARKLR